MRILKKKSLSIVEVYAVFTACMIIGYLSYLMIINKFIF